MCGLDVNTMQLECEVPTMNVMIIYSPPPNEHTLSLERPCERKGNMSV